MLIWTIYYKLLIFIAGIPLIFLKNERYGENTIKQKSFFFLTKILIYSAIYIDQIDIYIKDKELFFLKF